MAEEAFGWLFVGSIPLLHEKSKVARQSKIESWLDLAQIVKELGIENLTNDKRTINQKSYIV